MRIFATLALLWSPSLLLAQTRIACLGDSITYGARIADREHSSYPGWLNDYFDTEMDVRNFGVGGTTLLAAGDRPFTETKEFAAALAWQPDIAVIVLGTNDTCQNDQRHNWQHHESLAQDATRMIKALHTVRPKMRILLCSPTAMFADKVGLPPERQQDLTTRAPRITTVALAMQQVAQTMKHVEYLELRSCLRAQDVSDGVHPTAFGAERIARRIAEAVRSPRSSTAAQQEQLIALLLQQGSNSEPDTFHGFAGISFQLPQSAAQCRVFFPHGTARGAPWILRARFLGHEPELDIALLERGFHLVYCDVSNLYGSAEAIERYRELTVLLERIGLHRRAVLEGMSRGGLAIVNWAVAAPDRVAAIYGDNPVFDIRSWPGGNSGKRSTPDWERCLLAYGLTEASAQQLEPMPSERLEPLATAGVPMMLVLGMDDDVVPIAENGELLATRYREAGGAVEVWRKPGNGHHPHGLHPVEPLLRAVLRATGFDPEVATHASPSVEYRSGAGWNGDSWRTQVSKMRDLAKQHADLPIVFLGDSITQGLTGAVDRLAKPNGTRAIDRAFGKLGAISLGLSGDRTEHVLYRIRHGALQELTPKVIVLQIGVNNVVAGKHTAREVLDGIAAVLRELLAQEPAAEVLICGPFPAGQRSSATRQTIDAIHDGLQHIHTTRGLQDRKGIERASYLDLRSYFLNDDGSCNGNMRGDRIHISAAGQEAWMQAVLPAVQQRIERR